MKLEDKIRLATDSEPRKGVDKSGNPYTLSDSSKAAATVPDPDSIDKFVGWEKEGGLPDLKKPRHTISSYINDIYGFLALIALSSVAIAFLLLSATVALWIHIL